MKIKRNWLFIFWILSGFLFATEIEFVHVKSYQNSFSHPTDIVGNGSGDVFVLDGVNGRIVHLNLSKTTNFIYPVNESIHNAVGIDFQNGIWIADTPRHRLLKVDELGRIKSNIPLSKSSQPVDVCAKDNFIHFTDRNNHQIGVVDLVNLENHFIGEKGSSLGQFTFPGHMFQLNNSYFLISDIYNGRVVGMTANKSLFFKVASFGTQISQVYRPKGIGVDSKNRIWIADGYTGLIQAFDQDGTFLGAAKQNDTLLRLTTPTGIWIDQHDRIWVVESFSNTVSVWQIK